MWTNLYVHRSVNIFWWWWFISLNVCFGIEKSASYSYTQRYLYMVNKYRTQINFKSKWHFEMRRKLQIKMKQCKSTVSSILHGLFMAFINPQASTDMWDNLETSKHWKLHKCFNNCSSTSVFSCNPFKKGTEVFTLLPLRMVNFNKYVR